MDTSSEALCKYSFEASDEEEQSLGEEQPLGLCEDSVPALPGLPILALML